MNMGGIALLILVLSIGMAITVIGSDIGLRGDLRGPFPDHTPLDGSFAYDSEVSMNRYGLARAYPGHKQVVYNEDIIELIEQIDESTALTYIEGLVSFGPRVTGTPACDDAGDYIYDEFADMGLEVRYHYWSNGGYSGNNIEATLPGVDPSSDEIYIICGHYDSVSGCPGADDNASGTAATMVAAEIMSQYAFNHTVRFVAFSGEEQWMLGSHVYVQEAYQNGDNIVAALNVDMIGYAESEYDRTHVKVYHDDPSLWIVDFTDTVAEEYYDYINLDVIPSGFAYSDNYSFWEFGYHAVFYHEWNFNPYYHTPNDIIENMDLTYEMRCCKLSLATLAELAEMTPLGYIEGFVSDAATGDPLSAAIRVVGSNKETHTDSTGYYSLSVGDDSTYVVEASSYGYLPQEQEVYVPPDSGAWLDFELEAAEPGTIEGTVRSALDGQPLVDVEVTVLNTPLAPEYTDENGYFSFTIPGGATYQVQAVLPTWVGETQSAYVEENGVVVLSFALDLAESFEDDDGGYTGLYMWEWGTPSSYGPGGAHWGDNCWATNLDGPYGGNANSPLTSRTYDLVETTSASLNFYHWYESESGHDGGNVKISTDGGSSWTLITPQGGYPTSSMNWNDEAGYTGTSEGWELATFDLESYLGEQVKFKFTFGSDGSVNGPGWYIDDVYLELSYPVSVSLVPDSPTVQRGSDLGFTVTGTNAADYPVTLSVWSDVLLPGGTPYWGNPIFGPYSLTLPAQSNPSVHLSQFVPIYAPLGTYTYIMKVGLNDETIYARGFFDFTVIP
ncbi:MAG: M28 family peptidase [Candidatus Glassbacteria bacterium]